MSGGSITNNTASWTGGGVVYNKGLFTQTGGTVSGNKPNNTHVV